MFNWKKIMVLGAVVASLFVTSIPAMAAEFEEADYVKTTSYKEVMKPTESMDGILSIEGFDPALAEGLVLMTPFDANATDDATVSFVTKFKEQNDGLVPNQFAADGYDVVMVIYEAMKAADELSTKYGVEAEVIDARSIVPFNYEKVVESVKKTGRIVLASDACARGSILNDFARNIEEMCFDYLDAPAVVCGARNWITPPYEFEKEFFPQSSWIIDCINDKILPLKGHVSSTDTSDAEMLRRAKKGV